MFMVLAFETDVLNSCESDWPVILTAGALIVI